MDYIKIRKDLKENGYTVIENVISEMQVNILKILFKKWRNEIDFDPLIHGIYKRGQIGHQEFMWLARIWTAGFWKKLLKTEKVVTSFDGACYMNEGCTPTTNKTWTHTDQRLKVKGHQYWQGILALTTNEKSTLCVYPGSHLLHEEYGKTRPKNERTQHWHRINKEYLKNMNIKAKLVKINAGSMALFDSRTFHQNVKGGEEREVLYISMKEKNHAMNNKKMIEKRLNYFKTLRTTSHKAYPLNVNSLQTRNYGNENLNIDYSKLNKPYLDYMIPLIKELI